MRTEHADDHGATVGRYERLQGLVMLGLAAVVVVVHLVVDLGGWGWPLAGAAAGIGTLRLVTAPLQARAIRWAGRKGAERRARGAG